MKSRFLASLMALCLLTACGSAGSDPPEDASPSLAGGETPYYLTCRIIDGAEDGTLLLAALDQPLHEDPAGFCDGKSVYRLTVSEDTAVTLDGQPASAADLRDGMTVELAFDGIILDSFPGQLGQVYSLAGYAAGGLTDLCGLYLQVLDDLWEKDPALNENIAVAALDLSQAPGGLLESEKSALAWRFGEKHGTEVLQATWEQLSEQGCLTEETGGLGWPDGCLFVIRVGEEQGSEVYSLPAVFFDAGKQRAPLAAYWFTGCSAVWPESGGWSGYQIGNELIC